MNQRFPFKLTWNLVSYCPPSIYLPNSEAFAEESFRYVKTCLLESQQYVLHFLLWQNLLEGSNSKPHFSSQMIANIPIENAVISWPSDIWYFSRHSQSQMNSNTKELICAWSYRTFLLQYLKFSLAKSQSWRNWYQIDHSFLMISVGTPWRKMRNCLHWHIIVSSLVRWRGK